MAMTRGRGDKVNLNGLRGLLATGQRLVGVVNHPWKGPELMRTWKTWRMIALCCMSSLCLLYGAASASAHSRYTFMGSFGAAGSGAGQLSLTGESGVAVNNETHDVYVA